jgi:hypothetical protein
VSGRFPAHPREKIKNRARKSPGDPGIPNRNGDDIGEKRQLALIGLDFLFDKKISRLKKGTD